MRACFLSVVLLVAFPVAADENFPLAQARRALKTQIFFATASGAAPDPPAELFTKIHSRAPLG